MGRYCFVEGCESTKYKSKHKENKEDIPFYGFPNDSVLRGKWIHALVICNQQKSALQLPKYSKICIKHFSNDCIEKFGFQHVRLKRNSIPSIFPRLPIGQLRKSIDVENINTATKMTDNIHSTKATESINRATYTDIEGNEAATEREEDIYPTKSVELIGHTTTSCNEEQIIIIDTREEQSGPSTAVANQENIVTTPQKSTFTLRYPGDITENSMKDMTPRTMKSSINLLKRACDKKNTLIKRLRMREHRQKKKIEKLSKLLVGLKKNGLISSNVCDVLQVFLRNM